MTRDRVAGKEECISRCFSELKKNKKIRWILSFVTCTCISALMIWVIIYSASKKQPKLPSPNHVQEWYKKESVYEILIQSFQDSFNNGIGDIKGILDRLNHIVDVGSQTIYIYSMYECNDNDHNVVVNQTKIDSMLGTMDDFDMLLSKLQEKKIHLIVDFIPNHTSRQSKWFIWSEDKKGNYSDYYIWAPCDPSQGIYPNNWMSVNGKERAWSYSKKREECFLHQLEEDKPDLNLRNPDVQQELKNILRFWLDKGVDGFHVQNVQYLYEEQNLGNEILIPGKTEQAYGDFEHNQTKNHPENAKILQDWKSVLDTYSTKPGKEKALIITADDDLNATQLAYIDAGVTMVRVDPLSGHGASLGELMENRLKEVDFKKTGWVFSDKYSSRLASREGSQQTKALLTLQATLPGVLFNYYGNEIGMTDHPELPVPYKYRTPMQWNSNGTGFSRNDPWMPKNPNYPTVNVKSEEANGNNNSTLNVYKRLQQLRKSESFLSGDMKVFRDGDLMMYTRKAQGFPGYLVAINFGNKRVTESFYKVTGIPQQVKVVFHSHKQDNTAIDLSRNSYILDPYQAMVLEYK
uniref:Neutral and basic amino acid transport protein rBAT-like isoform X1 n=2 Tax=Crassostrea virginica TaxID=6565 RepID=A0A8B8D168_CRAVI|nr:neutral and basic amino acid transport protein rBAT-like isoform X1 [Crassostrea virginica]